VSVRAANVFNTFMQVIFVDEIDAIAPARDTTSGQSTPGGVSARLLTTLLTEMDRLQGKFRLT
jgi:SpoVK/Ycf46/Vps4 family AAA+-type ATPase